VSSPRPSTAVYVISVAATLVGSHPQTLRAYERLGLVSPLRRQGGSRLYSEADIVLLRRITQLSAEGVSLPGIIKIFALEREIRRLEGEIERLRSRP